MAYAGIDVGDATSCIALTHLGHPKVTIAQNSDGGKETSTIVQYGEKLRSVGFKATGGQASAAKHTVTHLKRLLGRDYADVRPEDFLFDVAEAPASSAMPGRCLLQVRGHLLSPEQVLASVLKDLKQTGELEASAPSFERVVLAVPCFYGQAQRHSMLAAAQVAGLHNVTLMHELTAAAVDWVASRPEFPDIMHKTVAFVDVGHSATQVCIVKVRRDALTVKAHAWDASLGGHDLDKVLVQHFSDQFRQETGLDVMSNPKAKIRMAKAVSKCRHLLTVSQDAEISIDSLMDDTDFRSSITRDKFEELAHKLLQRVEKTLRDALATAQVRAEDVAAVERVGGTSRTPAIVNAIKKVFRFAKDTDPKATINQKECVARGCAIHAATATGSWWAAMPVITDMYPYLTMCSFFDPYMYGMVGTPYETFSYLFTRVPRKRPLYSLAYDHNGLSLPLGSERLIAAMDLNILSDPVGMPVYSEREQEHRSIITATLPDVLQAKDSRQEGTWRVKVYFDDSGILSMTAKVLMQGQSHKVDPSNIQHHEDVPRTVIEQWLQQEMEMQRRDQVQLGKDRARNELERQLLQLRRRTAGDWANFVGADRERLADASSVADGLLGSAEDTPEAEYRRALEALESVGKAIEVRAQPPPAPPPAQGLQPPPGQYSQQQDPLQVQQMQRHQESLDPATSELQRMFQHASNLLANLDAQDLLQHPKAPNIHSFMGTLIRHLTEWTSFAKECAASNGVVRREQALIPSAPPPEAERPTVKDADRVECVSHQIHDAHGPGESAAPALDMPAAKPKQAPEAGHVGASAPSATTAPRRHQYQSSAEHTASTKAKMRR